MPISWHFLSHTIASVPDYLPLTCGEFFTHFRNIFTPAPSHNQIVQKDSSHTEVYGYSCRSLFELCLRYYQSIHHKNLTICTTPLHHTSFKNILEKYVPADNIHIIHFNENFHGLVDKMGEYDLVIITHLFGQDLDLSFWQKQKEKYNFVFIEDRVQGGTLDKDFSHEVVDIALYSMGMDKRPVALGGGFIKIKNNSSELRDLSTYMEENIYRLSPETRLERLSFLFKKIPTYLIYNCKIVSFVLINFIKLLKLWCPSFNVVTLANKYRQGNPGFAHHHYLKFPSHGLLQSMKQHRHTYPRIENLYTSQFTMFRSLWKDHPHLWKYYFPWYHKKDPTALTPYNTVYIGSSHLSSFLQYCQHVNIIILKNPTYKVITSRRCRPHEHYEKYQQFVDGLVYVPSLANMSRNEMKILVHCLKHFYQSNICSQNY